MQRESGNYQFDFLKPSHMNFKFFTQLVEQYRTIIQTPPEVREEVDKLSADVFSVCRLDFYRSLPPPPPLRSFSLSRVACAYGVPLIRLAFLLAPSFRRSSWLTIRPGGTCTRRR